MDITLAKAIAFAVTTAACQPATLPVAALGDTPQVAVVVTHGVTFVLRGHAYLTQSQLALALDNWVAASAATGHWTTLEATSALDGLVVVIDDSVYQCGDGSHTCAGVSHVFEGLVSVGWPGGPRSLCKTSLWHELVHIAMWRIDGDSPGYGPGHASPLFDSIPFACQQ